MGRKPVFKVVNGRLYGAVDENGNAVSTKELEVQDGRESKK